MRVAILDERAKIPVRKNPTDAGVDVFALETTSIKPLSYGICRTGISVEVLPNQFILIKEKSRANYLIGAGVIDPYYQPGEVLVKIFNPYPNSDLIILGGQAIAQLVVIPIVVDPVELVFKETLEINHQRSGKGGIVNQIDEV